MAPANKKNKSKSISNSSKKKNPSTNQNSSANQNPSAPSTVPLLANTLTNTPKSKKSKANKNESKAFYISDYLAVPVEINTSTKQIHYIYFKKHTSTNSINTETPFDQQKTIFLVNIPADSSLETIKAFFKPLARVKNVFFSEISGNNIFQTEFHNSIKSNLNEPSNSKKSKNENDNEQDIYPVEFGFRVKSGSCCHVEFLEEAEATRVFSGFSSTPVWPSCDTSASNSEITPSSYRGLQKYLFEYRGIRPPENLLNSHLTSYMNKFELKQYERERLHKAALNVPDEDGFITVVHNKNKLKNLSNFNSPSSNLSSNSYVSNKIKARNDKIHKTSFYRYQQRENNKLAADSLKIKFQQDKLKIVQLKQTRKFKPY
ncbi:Ribosomal RNA-processing protein 7 [Smittium culicis]|uniref:Ribosomal RNA-processing protein 7 n=1 Tax=Smittium culicis TaxID=133412 RepID=A0A1R1XZ58_9FUNG|nr:Ribosomal RNA-processing protein 7 [Smittium culicis]